jgi:hypothetical protein
MSFRFFIATVFVSISLMGCKGTKNASADRGGKVGNKKIVEILSHVKTNESNTPNSLSFRTHADIISTDKTTSIKASVRMVTDSVVWISITAYSYEVARVIATPDSLKYVSRTDKKYFVGDYEFIKTKMGVEFTFHDLQALLLAQSFGLTDPSKISKRNDKSYYVLSSLNRKEIKNIQKGKELLTPDIEVLYTNWINPESFKTEKVNLLDVNSQNSASIQYLTFENLSNYPLLSSFKMNIIAKTPTEINAKMSKFAVDVPLKFPFKISSKYEQIGL